MDISPSFYPSLTPSNDIRLDIPSWDKAVDQFKDKEFKASFYSFLDYLNPALRKGVAATEYTFPHASCVIHINLSDTGIEIKARVVKLNSDSLRIPLMRALCEINHYNFALARVILADDEVVFYHNSEYEVSSPRKLYGILSDICRVADSYSAEFIEKFKVARVEAPIIEQYPSPVVEKAFTDMHEILDASFTKLNEYETERRQGLRHCTIGFTLTSLEFYLQPQGYLKTLVDSAIWDFFDYDNETDLRLNRGREFLEELKAMPKEDVIKYLYRTQELTPLRSTTNFENIRSNWTNAFDRVKSAMADQGYEFATMEMLNAIYMMLSYNNVPDDISKPLFAALKKASNQPWSESAKVLYDVCCFIMIDGHVMKSERKGGLFNRLFTSSKK